MNEKFQKWINNIPTGPLEHIQSKFKHGFHGNMVRKENRAKMYMNQQFQIQISSNLRNHFKWFNLQ